MHVGTDFLKLPPVTGQYWSLFQCSMLGTGGTCDVDDVIIGSTGLDEPDMLANHACHAEQVLEAFAKHNSSAGEARCPSALGTPPNPRRAPKIFWGS